MTSWTTTLLLYAAIVIAAGISSFFFDWIFVFAISLGICLVSVFMFFFQGASWLILGQVWLAIGIFHVSYFCIGLSGFYWRLKLVDTRAKRDNRNKGPQR